MRYLVAFFCALFALAALPPSASAQGDQGTQKPHLVWDGGALLLGGSLEAGPTQEWAEWSDLEWMLWLVQAETAVEPEPAWPPPSAPQPPAEGSWLRLEADASGLSVIPIGGVDPPTHIPTKEEERPEMGVRVGIPVAVSLVVVAIAVGTAASMASLNNSFK